MCVLPPACRLLAALQNFLNPSDFYFSHLRELSILLETSFIGTSEAFLQGNFFIRLYINTIFIHVALDF